MGAATQPNVAGGSFALLFLAVLRTRLSASPTCPGGGRIRTSKFLGHKGNPGFPLSPIPFQSLNSDSEPEFPLLVFSWLGDVGVQGAGGTAKSRLLGELGVLLFCSLGAVSCEHGNRYDFDFDFFDGEGLSFWDGLSKWGKN